jgi:Domain of unknown function (DUF6883)
VERPIDLHRREGNGSMKVPNFQSAAVPSAKITDYLLSETHADGKHKAAFFESFGFTQSRWQELQRALRQHIADHDVAKVEPSPFGMRYVVEGIMKTPDGRSPLVRSVWFIDNDEETPRFVTAYPLRSLDHD